MTSAPDRSDATARRYHERARRFWLLAQVLDRVVALLFWGVGLSAGLASWAVGLGPRPIQILLYGLAAGVLYTLVLLPLRIASGYRLQRAYGLLNQTFAAWLADVAKAGALGAVFGLAALEFFYWTLAVSPGAWWLICAVVSTVVSLVLGFLAPIVIAPLFFHFKPLAQPDVADRIQGVLQRGGFQAKGVFEFDLSRKVSPANAAVLGFGPTRRIVLADSLLARYEPAEIEAVVAHELGHHAHRDMWLGTAAGAGVVVVALAVVAAVFSVTPLAAIAPLSNLASLPLWMLVFDLCSFALNPLALALSRWSERRADAYARVMSSEPGALATGLARLGREGLADPNPPRWEVLLRYTHPPMAERTQAEGSNARLVQAR